MQSRHHRSSHTFVMHYPRTKADALYTLVALPAIFLGIVFLLIYFIHEPTRISAAHLSPTLLIFAAGATLGRLVVAYAFSMLCAIPLAIVATHSRTAQKIVLPLFDILQSIPILAFFPALVAVFLVLHLTEVAAVVMLFLTMVWTIVFALVGGVGLIPRDIIYAAEIFGVKGLSYIRRIVLPALVPQMVIGSVLALAQGWNIIIVVEVIRTYLPASSNASNLFGLGSMLVEAETSGNTGLFLAALATTAVIIALINLLVWQRLLNYAQRFKFE